MTAQLKPKPIRKKRTSSSYKPKTMTEQTTRTQPEPTEFAPVPPVPVTITKVQSHLPDVQLIEREALWEDFKTRMSINNYEVSEAMRQLKEVVHRTHEVVLPTVDKAVSKFKEYTSDK